MAFRLAKMHIEQIYTGCLAQGAYFISSENEAVVIDPLREPMPYLERAQKGGVAIKYIFETHFHADFVSGHLDLAKATSAPIVFGPNANPEFDCIVAENGRRFTFGNASLEVIHTPGHTLESACYLLRDEHDKPVAIFTGDTLFIGDVGRPDLAQKGTSLTEKDLAGMLYDSLRARIMTLPHDVVVYPAHGAGSACGKKMSKETSSTIGAQLQENYALRAGMSRDEFIREVTDGLAPPPSYFPMNVALNRKGYSPVSEVMQRGLKAVSCNELNSLLEMSGAILLDTRKAPDFAKGHIPGSINIGLEGQFAPWVGQLIPGVNHPLILVTEPGKERESILRLSRVGYDHVLGILEGGFESWVESGREIDRVNRITAAQFHDLIDEQSEIIDVRRPGEYEVSHVAHARNLPLDFINENMGAYPDEKTPFFLHCLGGYRSMIAASILKSRGIHHFMEVEGGFNAIAAAGVALETSKSVKA